MLKQLGIAVACGIALHGAARYINKNYVLLINTSGKFPDLLATHSETLGALETLEATERDTQARDSAEDAVQAEGGCGDSGQSSPSGAVMQVAPCP